MTTIRRRIRAFDARHDDSGSSLIIALFFIIVVAFTVTALITFAGGALVNTANLRTQRTVEYAANTGTDLAIQAVRYYAKAYDTAFLTQPENCFGPATLSTSGPSTPTPTSNKRTVVVYCKGTEVAARSLSYAGPTGNIAHVAEGATTITTSALFGGSTSRYVGFKLLDSGHAFPTNDTAVIVAEHSTGKVTLAAPAKTSVTDDTLVVAPIFERTVTFFTCVAKGSTAPECPDLSSGQSNYVVHAVVGFDDVTPTPTATVGVDVDRCGSHAANTTCGAAMSVEQWVVQPANS